jgi:predicted alpha/beta hydrolase
MSDGSPATTDRLFHGTPCTFETADGFTLHGQLWRAEKPSPHTALFINAATGVAARYYHRYATYLAQQGYLVLTYDYRGIGASRPAKLRGLRATKHDWGALDCEAAIQTLNRQAPDLPMMAVCHSIGGFTLGLAPSAPMVRRALFVGCQYAYWQDYRLLVRVPMWLNWHLIMPVLTTIFGYFPGKTLRWLEDLPAGVAMEWATRFHPDFHKRYHRLQHAQRPVSGNELETRMGALQADILAIADVRDPFATIPATRRLLEYFFRCHCEFSRIDPRREKLPKLGHFGFFHSRFQSSLWPKSLEWLSTGHNPWSTSYRWPRDNTS